MVKEYPVFSDINRPNWNTPINERHQRVIGVMELYGLTVRAYAEGDEDHDSTAYDVFPYLNYVAIEMADRAIHAALELLSACAGYEYRHERGIQQRELLTLADQVRPVAESLTPAQLQALARAAHVHANTDYSHSFGEWLNGIVQPVSGVPVEDQAEAAPVVAHA